MAHKKTTGKKAASAAGKVLASKKSTKAQKAAAASALGQTRGKKHWVLAPTAHNSVLELYVPLV